MQLDLHKDLENVDTWLSVFSLIDRLLSDQIVKGTFWIHNYDSVQLKFLKQIPESVEVTAHVCSTYGQNN